MFKVRTAVDKSRLERGYIVTGGVTGSMESVASAALDRENEITEGLKKLALDAALLRKNRVFRGHEQEAGTMAYKMLRTQVYQALKRNHWKSLGVTSANPSEGKTTSTINLALSLAHSVYEKVILIDFDLRRPNVHATLGIKPEIGLSDFYTNPEIGVKDVMYNTGDDLIIVVPGRESLTNASELLVSHRTKFLLNSIKAMYPNHYILFDLPPVLVVDDVIAFTDKDACLVVAAEGRTRKEDIANAMQLLKTQNILGYVLNMSGTARMGYYAKYGYY